MPVSMDCEGTGWHDWTVGSSSNDLSSNLAPAAFLSNERRYWPHLLEHNTHVVK